MEQRDDFKVIFDANKVPEPPQELENKIMAQIELQQTMPVHQLPKFSMNLGLFSLCLFIFSAMNLLQYFTHWDFQLFIEAKQVALLSAIIFFGLWLFEIIESVSQKKSLISGIKSKLFAL